MKKLIALTLAMALLLCGCGGKTKAPAAQSAPAPTIAQIQAPTTEPTTEPTTAPTTAPPEPPVYYNPLNGSLLDAPFTGRVWANTISNMQENMPHVNVVKADIVMEMFVNMNNIVRCLALYTDFDAVEAVGSTRSTRPIFNDIAQHYDLVLSYAGGSETALNDLANRGVDGVNIDTSEAMEAGASYRDKEYNRSLENSLFGVGSGIKALAESKGIAMELDRDYGLNFVEDGTPADGENASQISVTFTYNNGNTKKNTTMMFDGNLGKYVWNQYGKPMADQITGQAEAFTNVIIMDTVITNNGIYHAADFNQGGTGYYANGSKIIPITWTCDGEKEPFRYYTMDGQPLSIGQGNTYIGIIPTGSAVSYS